MKVQDLMSTPAYTCGHTSHIDEAARLMRDNDVGSIPVTDASGRLKGVITDRDVSMAAYSKAKRLAEIPVRSVMSTPVHSCDAQDDVATAVNRMRDAKTRRLPVTDGNQRVVGVFSLDDAARGVARSGGDSAAVTTAVAQALATRSKLPATP